MTLPFLSSLTPEQIHLLEVAAPIWVATILLIQVAWQAVEAVSSRAKNRRARMAAVAELPEVVRNSIAGGKGGWFQAWNAYTGRQINRVGWKIGPGPFLFLSVTLAMLAMVATFWVSRNVFVTIAVAILLIFIPSQMLSMALQRQEQRVLNELPVAIQLFVVEYDATKNIREAMSRTAEAVGNPLRKYLVRCAQDLGAGRRPREAFSKLAADLDCDYGRLWTQLLLASTEDATVVKMMLRLITRLGEQRLLVQKNATELSMEKRIGMILNLLVLPGFIATQVLLPDSREFFSMPLGRVVIVFVFLSVVVGMALDQLLHRVDL